MTRYEVYYNPEIDEHLLVENYYLAGIVQKQDIHHSKTNKHILTLKKPVGVYVLGINGYELIQVSYDESTV